MKIIVLGATGMLGQYVTKYFQKESAEKGLPYEVIPISRKDGFDVTKLSSAEIFGFLGSKLGDLKQDDVIINAIGLTKQKNADSLDYLKVNSMFPWILFEFASGAGCQLIHPSTDCVYDGKSGDYIEFDPPNPNDVYGMSKALADCHPATIIRTSVIGEELNNKLSFVEFAKSNTGKKIKGYTNHFWNGITCLQWAKLVQLIVDEGGYWNGVKHITSPEKYSKYTMLTFLDEIYDLNLDIEKYEHETPKDMTLSSLTPHFDVPDLRTQIKEMKEFNLNYELPKTIKSQETEQETTNGV